MKTTNRYLDNYSSAGKAVTRQNGDLMNVN